MGNQIQNRKWIVHAYELSISETIKNESLDFSLYLGATQDHNNSVEKPNVVFTFH